MIKFLRSKLKSRSFASDALQLSVGSGIAQFISLLGLPFITRIYNPADFGLFALYSAIAWIIAVIATFQLEHLIALPRYYGIAAFLSYSIVLSSFFTCILFEGIAWIARNYIDSTIIDTLGLWIYFVPFTSLLIGISQALRYWLFRINCFKDVAINAIYMTLSATLLSIVLGYVFLYYEINGNGLIIAQILSITICNLHLLILLYKTKKIPLIRINKRVFFYTYAKYKVQVPSLLFANLMKTTYGRLPLIIIGECNTDKAAGYYSLVDRIAGSPSLLLANAIGDVYRQRAAQAWNIQGNFLKLFEKTFLVLTVTALPVFLLGIVVSPVLFANLFGDTWFEAGQFAQILLLGECAVFISTPLDKGCIIVGANRYLVFWHFGKFLSKLCLLAYVIQTEPSVYFVLWSLTLIRILFSLIDVVYSYKYALLKRNNTRT